VILLENCPAGGSVFGRGTFEVFDITAFNVVAGNMRIVLTCTTRFLVMSTKTVIMIKFDQAFRVCCDSWKSIILINAITMKSSV
jgi:hypothetical protein